MGWHVAYYPGEVTVTSGLDVRDADHVAQLLITKHPSLQVHVRECDGRRCRDCWRYSRGGRA